MQSNIVKHYKVTQHPGDLGRGATVRVSFLFLVTFLSFLFTKKRKKVTERYEIKEEFLIKNHFFLNSKVKQVSKIYYYYIVKIYKKKS
jgi:hypothetical protein